MPEPGADKVAGVKLAEIPLGNPVTEKETAALKPPLTRDRQFDTVVRSSCHRERTGGGARVKCGRSSGVAPVADKNGSIDGAKAGGLVISCRGVETGLPGNAVVAAGDVMKNGCSARPLFRGQGIERQGWHCPVEPPHCCTTNAIAPANDGAAADVPPTT